MQPTALAANCVVIANDATCHWGIRHIVASAGHRVVIVIRIVMRVMLEIIMLLVMFIILITTCTNNSHSTIMSLIGRRDQGC